MSVQSPMHADNSVTVDIVLATYNGEKFLAQQLDSLLAQKHDKLRILISDDGSSDASVAIIRAYAARDERIQIVNTVRQGGVVANFSAALAAADGQYLMFCDQDDIWLEDKVDTMLAALKAREHEFGTATALLGFSDLTVVDSHLQVENISFYASNRLNPVHNADPRYLLWSSTVYGCTTIFNRALADLGRAMPSGLPMHDQWLALLAASVGQVFYVPCKTILYRQHSANVVGAKRKGLRQRLASWRRNLGVIANDVGKCRLQFRAGVAALKEEGKPLPFVFRYQLDQFASRIAFVRHNVVPFVRERTAYAVLFSAFFLFRSHEPQ